MLDQPLGNSIKPPEASGAEVPPSDKDKRTVKQILTPAGPLPPTPAPVSNLPSQPLSVRTEGVAGMIITQEALIDESRLRTLIDPLKSEGDERRPSRELFAPGAAADGKLLREYVTDQRLRALWAQLEALQEEVIQSVRADRNSTDTYQRDLLDASNMLLQSTDNYDESRQIVFRVRADLARERRVMTDIRKYRPRLLLYHVGWLVVWLIGTRLDAAYRTFIPDELPILKLAYAPILFGVLGALANGFMALHEHTTVKRDFDPVHFSWYLINPLIGGLLGMVVFLFFVVTGSSFTPTLATDRTMANTQAPLVIWLLAFVVGWQQNIMFRLLNKFLKTVTPEEAKEAALTERPSAPAKAVSDSQPKG